MLSPERTDLSSYTAGDRRRTWVPHQPRPRRSRWRDTRRRL